MALTLCPECGGKISDKALACPACGYPMARQANHSPWPGVIGGIAGTYISAKALVMIIVGSLMFMCFAAIMIALVVGT